VAHGDDSAAATHCSRTSAEAAKRLPGDAKLCGTARPPRGIASVGNAMESATPRSRDSAGMRSPTRVTFAASDRPEVRIDGGGPAGLKASLGAAYRS